MIYVEILFFMTHILIYFLGGSTSDSIFLIYKDHPGKLIKKIVIGCTYFILKFIIFYFIGTSTVFPFKKCLLVNVK